MTSHDGPEAPAGLSGTGPAGLPSLPKPSELGRRASAPPGPGDLLKDALLFDGELPSQRIMDVGSELLIEPDWSQDGNSSPDGLAYVGYRFSNLSEFDGPAIIRLLWVIPPPFHSDCYLAVADFSQDAWRWSQAPDDYRIQFSPLADCINGSGELFALVLLGGNEQGTLDWLILGDRLPPQPELSADLDPDPALNVAPLVVNFNATGSYEDGGQIVAWDFDFEADGSWDVEGDGSGLVQHVYNSPGATTCKLRIHDDIDQQAETTIDFWVVNPANTPPTAHFTATPDNGPAPLAVDLNASSTTDDNGIRLYEWDFDSDGVYERSTGDSASTSYIFGINGANDVWLRVTDLDYATATYQGQVTVSGGFTRVYVDNSVDINAPIAAGATGSGVNQRACVAWQEWADKDLLFSIATNEAGSDYTLSSYAAPHTDDTGYYPSLYADGGSFPLIAFGKRALDNQFDLEFVRATDATGFNWDGPYQVNGAERTGGCNGLVRVFGKPSIVSVENYGIQGAASLWFYQANDNDGTTWPAGQKLLDGTEGGTLGAVSILSAIVGFFEYPVVSYWSNVGTTVNDVGVMRGLDSAGSSWNDPAVFHNRDCRTTSLAMIAGHPGLAGGSYAQGGSLYYGRAGDSAGGIWPDGINEIVGGGYGGYCDLELVDGVPAICYYSFEGGDLWYVAAVDAEATAWNDPFIVASNGTVGEFCSMTVLGGDRPVIFYEDPGNFSLMAAYWQ